MSQMQNQSFLKANLKKILIVVGILILLALAFFGYKILKQNIGVDPNNLPQFVEANFIDLDAITSISKFRSSEGHDFSVGGETCRSMKHYFAPNADPSTQLNKDNIEEKIASIKPDGKTDINIYSPVSGTITQLDEEHTPIGKQVHIVPDGAEQFTIRLFHVWVSDDITVGKHVTAGQKIGVISAKQDTDVSVEYGSLFNAHYVSVFDVMTDKVFSEYQERGLEKRSDVIISKEERDANPLKCKNNRDEEFDLPSNYDSTDQKVYLTGYIDPQEAYDKAHPNGGAKNGDNNQNGVCPSGNCPGNQ